MGLEQSWHPLPLATVNRQRCSTEPELQRRLRKAVSKKLGLVEIAIHDPMAQRVFLSLAVYQPEELLPQGVGSLVADMRHGSTRGSQLIDKNLEISLAVTEVMNHSQSPTAKLVGTAVISAINQGYGNVSFGTVPQDEQTGAVFIWIHA